MQKVLTTFCLIIFSIVLIAQHQNLPLNYQLSQQLEYNALTSKQDDIQLFHNSAQPYIETFTPQLYRHKIYNDTGKYYYAITEKLFQKNLLLIEEEDLKLVADPLFNFSYGRTSTKDSLYKISGNTRGVRVAGDITKKFSFETRVYENQFFYPSYLDSIANIKTTAIGIGRSKPFKNTGHDAAMSSGYISYSPNQNINLQFGQGKHFIGNGYRSLLLSDNASPAPYFGITTQFFKNKLQYRSINSWMQSLIRLPATNSAEALFKRKGASFRYLSFSPIRKLQLGIFEGVIYENYVDSIGKKPLVPHFYLPIIGINTAINGLDHKNNSLLGLNVNYQLKNSIMIYGQFMIDGSQKNGFQLGGKWFNCFNSLNSWIQLEYNSISPYAYAMPNENILQSYTHTNQELAHPIGANFNEFILIGHLENGRWQTTGKLIFYTQKSNSSDGLSSSPLIPTNQFVSETIEYMSSVSFSSIEVSYLFNRKTNMQFFGNYSYRNQQYRALNNLPSINKFESFWSLGFRTTLLNFYHDI